ncbi:unnamed protein product [Cercospora beticola]|nr:unnamed protein product [Cercospora beticola]
MQRSLSHLAVFGVHAGPHLAGVRVLLLAYVHQTARFAISAAAFLDRPAHTIDRCQQQKQQKGPTGSGSGWLQGMRVATANGVRAAKLNFPLSYWKRHCRTHCYPRGRAPSARLS